jgi:hypothetical protein
MATLPVTTLGSTLPVDDYGQNKVTTYNTAISTVIEPTLIGKDAKSLAALSSPLTLTAVEARNPLQVFTSASGAFTIKMPVPTCPRVFVVYNTSGQVLTIKTTAGGSTGPSIATGLARLLFHDDTNVYSLTPDFDPTGATFVFEPSADSASVIKVKNASGVDVWTVDTTTGANGDIGRAYIGQPGTMVPTAPLSIIETTGTTDPHGLAVYRYQTDTTNPSITFLKARGTPTSPTVLASGDFLGTLNFYGYYGTGAVQGFYNAARIRAQATEAYTSTTGGTRLYFVVTPNGSVSIRISFIIDNDGVAYIGVETASGSPVTGKLSSTKGSGSNIAGAELDLIGGQGTGTGAGGTVKIQTSAPGVSSSSLNPIVDAVIAKWSGVAILGSNTNDSAAAGYVGEVITGNQATPQAMTSPTPLNVTSITLTPGDWLVSGTINFALAGATVTKTQASINTTSATLAGDQTDVNSGLQSVTTTVSDGVTIPPKRYSLSAGTTTIYLVAKSTFSAGTVNTTGSMLAHRIR